MSDHQGQAPRSSDSVDRVIGCRNDEPLINLIKMLWLEGQLELVRRDELRSQRSRPRISGPRAQVRARAVLIGGIDRFDTHGRKWVHHVPVVVPSVHTHRSRHNAGNTPLLCYSLCKLLETRCAVGSGNMQMLLLRRDLEQQAKFSRQIVGGSEVEAPLTFSI